MPGQAIINALRDPLPFMERVRNPQNAPPPLMEHGHKVTHSMAAEVGEDGNWYVFPTVQDMGGRLQRLPVQEAMMRALRTGNALNFEGDKEGALNFSRGGYKTDDFNRYYGE